MRVNVASKVNQCADFAEEGAGEYAATAATTVNAISANMRGALRTDVHCRNCIQETCFFKIQIARALSHALGAPTLA
ncbi:MAG: hypothetical protein M3Y37_06070, partial [Chloroflexota bacterium]|nr:hypothetical protein [Chloroflexota bacterium]